MADSKITALASIGTGTDPANDPLVIVDVSDVSPGGMSATGTTKKVTLNNLLACSPTATLASATITGDLTVDTSTLKVDSANNRVGVGTATPNRNFTLFASASPVLQLCDSTSGTTANDGLLIQQVGVDTYLENAEIGSMFFRTSATTRYSIDSTGVSTWSVGGSTAMTLNSTGLGVGVVPSAGKFEVQESGTGAGIGGIFASTVSGGGNPGFVFRTASTNRWSLSLTGSAGAESIRFYDINNSATRMTLDASGNLLVGVASGGTARLDIRTSASQRIINAFSTAAGDSSTYGVYIAKFANDSTTAQRFIGFTINNDGAGSGQINANGASQAAFGTFSDSRLKENIVSLPSQLANILSLRPVEFDYKDGSGHQIGFVAQEVQEVYSDAVSEQDGFLTVTGWSKTEARLVSAIKELADKVQALEAKLA